MREYFVRPKSDYEWWDYPNTEGTAKTVIETEELFDTGMLDHNGNKVWAREKKRPIGFVPLKERV